eukprot:TRINITY_DN6152_c2_g1_i1.p2 TRINITY_DN6152_c2_g1~~TRINITY_DN6152_c2_g1_i1.p2  ORF type:complete len:394 (+),score=89.11 TRINITY_DN6152_c2_g1_i1:49-1182(+)
MVALRCGDTIRHGCIPCRILFVDEAKLAEHQKACKCVPRFREEVSQNTSVAVTTSATASPQNSVRSEEKERCSSQTPSIADNTPQEPATAPIAAADAISIPQVPVAQKKQEVETASKSDASPPTGCHEAIAAPQPSSQTNSVESQVTCREQQEPTHCEGQPSTQKVPASSQSESSSKPQVTNVEVSSPEVRPKTLTPTLDEEVQQTDSQLPEDSPQHSHCDSNEQSSQQSMNDANNHNHSTEQIPPPQQEPPTLSPAIPEKGKSNTLFTFKQDTSGFNETRIKKFQGRLYKKKSLNATFTVGSLKNHQPYFENTRYQYQCTCDIRSVATNAEVRNPVVGFGETEVDSKIASLSTALGTADGRHLRELEEAVAIFESP